MEDKSLVIFTSILKEDAGLYICEADNPFNPTYSAQVIVKDRGILLENKWKVFLF
jgi:hypothetical protein